ncbi:MAG: hypothetical protein NT023_10755 [Armatimonadetes bacterium]|nr:hypothetical protein [Armatimonadota bacterium]
MPNQKRVILVTLAFAILWGYILLSSGSWLRWRQIRYLVSEQSSLSSLNSFANLTTDEIPKASPPDYLPQLKAVAERSQGWQEQYAYLAVSEPQGETQSLGKLLTLVKRYPKEPVLIAHWLRLVCLKYMPNPSKGATIGGKPEDPLPDDAPAMLSEFVSQVCESERRFPDNAYFRMMRITGLFAQHRDAEAERLLLETRNTAYRQYNDYAVSEDDAIAGLKAKALGQRETIFAIEDWTNTLFPHYARMREMARKTIASARRFEAQGQHAKALRLRCSIFNFGSLMFHQSQGMIGSLSGKALFGIGTALDEPTEVPSKSDEERKRRVQEKQDKFSAYLIQRRERPLSGWVDAEFREMMRVRDEAKKSLEKSPMGSETFLKSAIALAYDLLLLSNMARLLVLALLLLAFRRVQTEYAVLCGAGVILSLVLFVLWNPAGADVSGWQYIALIHFLGAAFPILLVIGTWIASLIKRKALLPMLTTSGVRAMTGTLLVLSLLYALSPSPSNERQWLRDFLKMKRNEASYFMDIAGEPLKKYQPIPPLNSSR